MRHRLRGSLGLKTVPAVKEAAPPGERKARLLQANNAAARRFNVAVEALSAARPQTTKQDYERMRTYREEARRKVEQTRLALESHVAEHGC